MDKSANRQVKEIIEEIKLRLGPIDVETSEKRKKRIKVRCGLIILWNRR